MSFEENHASNGSQWARSARMFDPETVETEFNMNTLTNLPPDQLDRVWSSWARKEGMKRFGKALSKRSLCLHGGRAALSLVIHDVELASLVHHEATIHSGSNTLHITCHDDIYFAPDAKEWRQAIQRHRTTQPYFRDLQRDLGSLEQVSLPEINFYTLYIAIVEIAARACNERADGTLYDMDAFSRYSRKLICWYRSHKQVAASDQDDPFCLMIYWHALFIYISVDMNRLEMAIGRDREGTTTYLDHVNYARLWASTAAAKRAVIHAYLLQKRLGARRIDQEPAIHVPRAIFHASLAVYHYAQNGGWTEMRDIGDRDNNLDFEEIKLLGHNPLKILCEIHGFRRQKPAPSETAVLCALHDVLQRFGHWGIAKEFANILDVLIFDESGHGVG
jgi:hypothetical protein